MEVKIVVRESGDSKPLIFLSLQEAARYLYVYPEEKIVSYIGQGWVEIEGKRVRIEYISGRR